MDDKILVIIMVTLLCLATLGVAMHSTTGVVPAEVIALIEKAMYGLFGIASGTGIGMTLANRKNKKDEKQEISQ